MLKSLAILAVLCVLAGVVPGQLNKAADQKQGHAAQSQPAVINPVSSNEQNHSQPNQPKPGSNPPSGHTSFKWPRWVFDSNWWLVIIAGLTGIFIGRQARLSRRTLNEIHAQAGHMEKQTQILRDSVAAAQRGADAALRNAQAVINSERAYLLFSVKKERLTGPHGPSQFHIEVINYGRVPARRIVVGIPHHAHMTMESFLAGSPDYEENPQEIVEWLAPKESWRVATFTPNADRSTLAAAAMSEKVSLKAIENIIYGQLVYDDGVSGEKRHSRYCLYHMKEPFRNIGGSLEIVQSDEYVECT